MTDRATEDNGDHYVRPTTSFWQTILPADDPSIASGPPYRYGYPARLPDGRCLVLPLRRLPDGRRAVASLIANQASFSVMKALSDVMGELARAAGAEQIVGMPTLGLSFAPLVAQRLDFTNYVPLGYSQKFWYRQELSEPVRSITTPGSGKSVFIDPNVVPRLEGRKIVVVDDAVSSGSTLMSVYRLLARLNCDVIGVVVAMRQGVTWRENLAAEFPSPPDLVRSVIAAPLFELGEDGWYPIAGTLDDGDAQSSYP